MKNPGQRLFVFLFAIAFSFSAFADELLPPGFRPVPPGVHALVGGKVFVKPGEVIESATIIIRDGFIEKVGKDISPPADARIWDMKGMTLYAGFIDPYLKIGTVGEVTKEAKKQVDLTSGRFFGLPGGEIDPGNTGAGAGVGLIDPQRRISEIYAPDFKNLEKMRDLGFTAANIVPDKGILRGSSAFVQLSDVDPNRAMLKPNVAQHVVFDNEGRKDMAYPESLMGIISVVRQTFFDAQHYATARDFYNKNGGKRPEFNPALQALQLAISKSVPVVFEPDSALMVDRAARVARELHVDFQIVSSGQEWRRPDLAKETGASFIVPLDFPELPKLPADDDWEQISLDQLRAWDWAPENAAVLRQQGLEVALTTHGLEDKTKFRKNIKGAVDRGLSEQDALAALTTIPAKLCGVEQLLGTLEPGKLANLTIVDGKGYFDPEAKVREVWIDGRNYHGDVEPAKKDKKKDDEKTDKEKAEKEKKETEKKEALKKRLAKSPLEGRGVITNPAGIYIYGATVWTSVSNEKPATLSILISDGKIQKIGSFKADAGPKTLTIDARGQHITPGLIDAHSHSAILHDVNEGTLPSSAMVRIGDVVNSETDNLYEELAGGLTTANLLHGSANPIGGQNQVIKLRDGASPEGLKFAEAPQGIKFALGENVKQSNWGEKYKTRFPQTRMGVKTFIRNRFIAAQQYLAGWKNYSKNGGSPPARDLELEAIGEILEGKRWIHSHSYRADEILMLLRLMQDFKVQIATFQHVLEGYKVADELAAGNVGGSTFADWWAYKFEVYDAIPYNGSLMRDRGVLVSFNSDSHDLARHLNFEAAKAVKFGGTPEEEALKFVTINPAKQLRIDKHVGSLEVGKDADFVIWSKSPLDSSTVCLQTWIDGKKYFDRDLDAQRTEAMVKERAAILEKAKKILGADGGGDTKDPEVKKFFRRSLEHQYDGVNRHCLDDEE
ncbi:MAG: amidohydrolase [Verrucomicrobiales bacterium]|nr:amidohydrolase [Verrucomicrobiales bacterium]